MPHFLTGTIVDYTNEKSAYRIPIGAITAVSIAGALADMGDLQAAIDGVIVGDRQKEGWIGDDTVLTSLPSSDVNAQVERAWLITYKGNTSNKLFQVTIATADISGGRLLPNSDVADLTETSMAALVTAFEAVARTPDSDLETVTVVRIQHVGRNR